MVKVEAVNTNLNSELKKQTKEVKKLNRDNQRLKRKLADEEGSPVRPRPGPAFKAWEDITPRSMNRVTDPIQKVLLKTSEKRHVDPVKLSGEVLFR